MKPVIIIAIAFVLLIPTTVFAAEGYFENDHGKQVSRVPTVCVFQPDDSRIDKQRWNNWYLEMSHAIHTWRSVMEQSGSGNWEITVVNVPLHELDRLNYSACDITVKFVEKPPIGNDHLANALGWASIGTGKISIVYSQYESCGKVYSPEYKIMLNTYCFVDNLERPKYMASVLQHEFGHIIGLGHYLSYNYVSMQNWYDTGIGYPSIMTHMSPNEELKKVTQIDVKAVREIYGDRGYGKFRNNDMPIFHDRVIPETIVESSQGTTITLSDNSQTTVLIDGNVPDKLYKRGVYLEIIIQNPYGSTEYKATSVSKTRHSYSYPLTIDSSSPSGTYKITHQFDGQIFYREEIHVTKIPSTFSASSQKNNEREETHQQNVAALVKVKEERQWEMIQNEIKQHDLRMTTLEFELNSIKDRVSETQKILDNTYNNIKSAENKYDSADSKKIIAKAWDIYNQVFTNFEKSKKWADEYDSKVGDLKMKSLEEQKVYYKSLVPEMKNFKGTTFHKYDKKLSVVTEELNSIKNIDKKSQTCFLFWCW